MKLGVKSLKDNATFAGISVKDINLENKEEYIREAKVRFDAYNTEDWIKAGFDENSGGYMTYHKKHHFDPTIGIFGIPRGDYEKITSKILMKYGMKVELSSEKPSDNKKPDGLLNDKIFDIKAVEGTGKENVLKDIKDASKKGAETVVLYFHKKDWLDEKQIHENYQTYLRNSKSKRIQQVYYIVDGKLHILK